MGRIVELQRWLKENHCQGLLIPSTDEFLCEFAPPGSQRLKWATGFTGAVGMAIVLQERAALVVDGRYVSQASAETRGLDIDIVPMSDRGQEAWLIKNLKRGDQLAFDPALHAFPEIEKLRGWVERSGIELLMLSRNPVDDLWRENRDVGQPSQVNDYPLKFAGQSSKDKCAAVCEWLNQEGLGGYLIADPEDVAWMLNVRAHDWPMVPVCLSRAFLESDGQISWCVERDRLAPALLARLKHTVALVPVDRFETTLRERARDKAIAANLRRTPWKLASVIADVGVLKNSPFIEHLRWRKNVSEIEGAKHAHHLDGRAIIRFLAWLSNAVSDRKVTELEAAEQLIAFRSESPEYLGRSMPLMSASGPSGALPHYVPTKESNRVLNDHPVYWIDSGGQYYGGTTDNTVAFALNEPERKHRVAHTLVLKGFIALAMTRFPSGTLASQLDSVARHHLWQRGMDYMHGTGHGVGSCLNIHEGPIISKNSIFTPFNAPIEAGMILSNEPSYYAPGDFGIRIESHMLTVPSSFEGFLEFETLSRLPIDPRLVDTSLLTTDEKRWLALYHQRVWAEYEGDLDAQSSAWLKEKVDHFIHG